MWKKLKDKIVRWYWKNKYDNIVAELIYEGRNKEDLMPFEEFYNNKMKP